MAWDFDDVDDFIFVLSSHSVNVPITIAAWYHTDDVGVDDCMVDFGTIGANTTHYTLTLTASGGVGARVRGDTGDAQAEVAGVSTALWQHGTAVFAANDSRTAYINGVAGTPETTTVNGNNATGIAIGALALASTFVTYNGRMAEIGIWGAALTANEILSLANGAIPVMVRPQSLIFYLPLRRALVELTANITMTTNGGVGVFAGAHAPIILPSAPHYYNVAAGGAAPEAPTFGGHILGGGGFRAHVIG